MKTDSIRIAGAGLSGLSAAICLAQRGYRVEIFERNADSGQTRHADWDAIENWTTEEDFLACLAQWGIQPTFEQRAPLAFEVYDPKGDCYKVELRRPFFYLLKRGVEHGSVEQALKAQALACGVTIHYNRASTKEEVDVWAAGARSAGFFLGTGITFRTSHPDLVAGLVDTLAAPKAYAYLVIVDGFATLSVVLTRDFRNARSYLEHCIRVFRSHKSFEMEDVRWTSGFGGLVSAFWQPASKVITVGEAAGLQDFLWGFGIRHAIHSGHLAARAVHEHLDYPQLVAREIHPFVRASMVNRMFYDRVGNRAYTALIRHFAASHDLSSRIRPWYRGLPLHKMMWPLTERHYRPREEK
jgi:flavin-dependent dehydrogenase